MASSLISSGHHIDFDSVFGFDDAELVQMFESLISTGLKVFLGFPAVFYEASLTEFFANSSAGSFDAVTGDRFMLMTTIMFDVKVNWSSLLFGILKEMVTPGSWQAKGYAIQICVLLKNIPGLELGKSRAFPVPRVLTEKTVHMYVVINEKVGTEEVADAPRVKKTPVKKAVSQNRPVAVEVEVAPVVKKKRTTKDKPVVIAQEAVPLQIIEGTAAVPVEQPPVPKRKIQKRKRRFVLEGEDEIVDDQPAVEAVTGMQEPVIENEQAVTEPAVGTVLVEPVVEKSLVVEPAVATMVNEGPSTADDVDDIIQQVLTETAQVETTDEGDPVDEPDVSGAHVEDQPAGPAAERSWFDLPYEDIIAQLNDRPVVTTSDTDEDMEPVVEEQSADEAMYLEDILMSILVEVPLPSAGVDITKITMGKEIKILGVDEGDWYKASLPKIHPEEKGKDILVEKDPVKGNPATKQIGLTLADIDCLVKLQEKVIDDVAKLFYSFSLKRLSNLKIDESYFVKEELVLTWAGAESTGVSLNRKQYILLKYREMLLRKFLEARRINFTPGDGSSAVDLKILDQLSDIHSFFWRN
ncbi:hypothetical protein F511_36383 [Dorcoceras hygrometricum]|uniref:Splicing factor 3B subunit 1-like n=1 Tax=Dorcoceras hygrometricum TaxID=472368 RepID=A0A2Z7BLP5_9LAMI|nr:hypothetical protein F511_36383 [Dorcoceras hygrometricum]